MKSHKYIATACLAIVSFTSAAFGQISVPFQSHPLRISPQTPDSSTSVLIDGCPRVQFQMTALRQAVGWELQLPDGVWVSPTNAAGLSVKSLQMGPGINGGTVDPGVTPIFLTFVELTNPTPGTYTFRALGGGPTTPEPVFVRVQFESSLSVSAFAGPTAHVIGVPMPIGACVSREDQSVLGATVTAFIATPQQAFAPITLIDDGTGDDPVASDGVYNAMFTPTVVGPYSMVVHATGTTPEAGSFRRDAATSFHVVTPGAVFNRLGGLQAFEQDLQNDTLYDRVAVVGQLNVTEVHDYTVWLTFADAQGRRIKTFAGVKPEPCAVNTTPPCGRPFQVFLTADEIRAAEIEFPIHLVEAELTRDTEFGTATVDLWNPPPPPNTGSVVLNLTAGARPQEQPIKLSPPMLVNRVDTDGDNLFDFLDVTFHVTVVKDGSYWFNAVLKDECDREVARAVANDIQMLGGPALWPVTFRFKGTDIGAHGIDSPWHIAEIMGRTWGFQTTFSGKLGWISPDLANQYENYTPPIDRNRNGIADDCEVFGGNADRDYNGYPDDVDANPCLMADIADDQGNAPPMPGIPNSGINEGDYNAFFNLWFQQSPLVDIADDQGNAPPQPGIPNGGVNEGDYNAFFNLFFNCQGSSSE